MFIVVFNIYPLFGHMFSIYQKIPQTYNLSRISKHVLLPLERWAKHIWSIRFSLYMCLIFFMWDICLFVHPLRCLNSTVIIVKIDFFSVLSAITSVSVCRQKKSRVILQFITCRFSNGEAVLWQALRSFTSSHNDDDDVLVLFTFCFSFNIIWNRSVLTSVCYK